MCVSNDGRDELLVREEESLAFVTFNRPQARNAMTWSMYDRLLAYSEEVDRNDAIRAVIFTGAGDQAFVAGTDISQFQAFHAPQDPLAYEQRMDRVLDRLERIGKPTIAMIRGYCTGGGLALAAACDFRYATPDVKMGIPIARTLGNCVSMNNAARLLDLVGPARAKEVLMQARLFEADDALALGLVNEIVPGDKLEARVREVVRTLGTLAPLTLRASKEAIRRLQAKRRLAPGEGEDLILSCYMSEDFKSAVQAFVQRRPPVWQGR
jgi:enoyl-CoA hydratase/carnithine racemase